MREKGEAFRLSRNVYFVDVCSVLGFDLNIVVSVLFNI